MHTGFYSACHCHISIDGISAISLLSLFQCFFLNRFTQEVNGQLLNHDGGGSGGYLEHILKYAAHNLFGHNITKVEYKVLRYWIISYACSYESCACSYESFDLKMN